MTMEQLFLERVHAYTRQLLTSLRCESILFVMRCTYGALRFWVFHHAVCLPLCVLPYAPGPTAHSPAAIHPSRGQVGYETWESACTYETVCYPRHCDCKHTANRNRFHHLERLKAGKPMMACVFRWQYGSSAVRKHSDARAEQ